MKMFMFEDADKVSDHYHDNGGLAIAAEDANHVDRLIEKEPFIEISEQNWEDVVVYELGPSDPIIYRPTIHAFPDSGCC